MTFEVLLNTYHKLESTNQNKSSVLIKHVLTLIMHNIHKTKITLTIAIHITK